MNESHRLTKERRNQAYRKVKAEVQRLYVIFFTEQRADILEKRRQWFNTDVPAEEWLDSLSYDDLQEIDQAARNKAVRKLSDRFGKEPSQIRAMLS